MFEYLKHETNKGAIIKMKTIIMLFMTGGVFINIANAQIDFTFTGTIQEYTVPAGVSSLKIEAWGAQGGGSEGLNIANQDDGGLGGYAQGTLMVTSGDELFILVGGKPVMIPGGGNTGGYNGGGNGRQYGGAGGGASDVRLNGSAFFNRILIAGGGGGGNTGSLDYGAGGAGGGLIGADGISYLNSSVPTGGTQSSGGIGANGADGSIVTGGNGFNMNMAGGGGGFWGGGAGLESGGAGGSSFIHPIDGVFTPGIRMINTSSTAGVRSSNGLVRITEVFSKITDGNSEYKYDNLIAQLTSFTVNQEDVLFHDWWYYRVNGDSREYAFPTPDFTTEFNGNKAILTWLDVDGRGLFSAQLIQVIDQPNINGATLNNKFIFTNLSNQSIQLDMFHYIDFDVGVFISDEAMLLSDINYISLINNETSNTTNTAQMRAGGNLAYQVGNSGPVKGLLVDDSLTALDNSGLPFGPADFSGVFQWSKFIPVSSSLIIEDSLAAGASTAPEPAQPLVFIDLIFVNDFE